MAEPVGAADGSGSRRPWRLFAALDIPAAWQRYLAARARALAERAPGAARWVAPDLMHLTVVFLGEQPHERLAAIQAALDAASTQVPPFELSLGGPGQFGGATPRVIWWEAWARPPRLPDLHRKLCDALEQQQIPFDTKPMVAHITLGRAARRALPMAGRSLGEALSSLAVPPVPSPCAVRHVTLYRSELGSAGPRYTVLSHHRLGDAP